MVSTNFRTIIQEDIRLVTLRVLNEDTGFSHNEYVIRRALSMMGHNISQDNLKTELHWLQEQGLIKLSGTEEISVATLTGRGRDVATGATVVPGVKRPEPGM